MEHSGFTLGPWVNGVSSVWSGETKIALVLFIGKDRLAEEHANAQLIADAPNLLAERDALRERVKSLEADAKALDALRERNAELEKVLRDTKDQAESALSEYRKPSYSPDTALLSYSLRRILRDFVEPALAAKEEDRT